MRFILTKGTLGAPGEVEITRSEFEEFVLMKQIVLNTLVAEEKFDLVIENYIELEQTLLNSILTNMVLGNHSYLSFNQKKALLDRRIYNLLSSCRSYIDYSTRFAKAMTGSIDEIKKKFSELYDSHFAYRLMEALRNFVTHGGLPIDVVLYRGETVDFPQGDFRLKFGADVTVKAERLKQYGGLKASVLQEIYEQGGEVSLLPLIREYISDLGNVHNWVRKECEHGLNDATVKVRATFERFDSIYPTAITTTALFAKESGEDSENREVSIFLDVIDYVKHFHVKNRDFVNLHKCIVSM